MMDNKIFYATVPLEMGSTKIMTDKAKHDYIHPLSSIGYALEQRTKNIIEFIIDSAVINLKYEIESKIRKSNIDKYDIKNIIVFEDVTMFKVRKLGFIAYIEIDDGPTLGAGVEFPCTEEVLYKVMKTAGFYVYMALKIQEMIRK